MIKEQKAAFIKWLGHFKDNHPGYTGRLKNLLECREQYIVGSPFSFVFPGCLTRRPINAARIVLIKSTINLNNFSSAKKHNL